MGRQASLAAQSFPSPKIAARDFFCLSFVLTGNGKLQPLRVFAQFANFCPRTKQSLCQRSLRDEYFLLISGIGDSWVRFSIAAEAGRGQACAIQCQFCDADRQSGKKTGQGAGTFQRTRQSLLMRRAGTPDPPVPSPARRVLSRPFPPKRPGRQASPAASRSLPPRIAAGDFFVCRKVGRPKSEV